ncbi:hypothetical protein [Bacillus sp. SD088]|uniref:hypothetical protein n=1 Tax=Bacillus sp. SD088 TaxID=2782012 RepID=UPI001A974732|nr:hypothetical protein [Bacillus sp. SD088]MBO0995065.1 hypothetical protein [Bacillus sp. SD088]
MNKYQKRTVYISVLALAFFLMFSIVTQNWGFFLWSLVPIFLVLMTTLFIKSDKKNQRNEKI